MSHLHSAWAPPTKNSPHSCTSHTVQGQHLALTLAPSPTGRVQIFHGVVSQTVSHLHSAWAPPAKKSPHIGTSHTVEGPHLATSHSVNHLPPARAPQTIQALTSRPDVCNAPLAIACRAWSRDVSPPVSEYHITVSKGSLGFAVSACASPSAAIKLLAAPAVSHGVPCKHPVAPGAPLALRTTAAAFRAAHSVP